MAWSWVPLLRCSLGWYRLWVPRLTLDGPQVSVEPGEDGADDLLLGRTVTSLVDDVALICCRRSEEADEWELRRFDWKEVVLQGKKRALSVQRVRECPRAGLVPHRAGLEDCGRTGATLTCGGGMIVV